ncbi:MAG: M14 family zinc carboxypeptidase, partial [Rhodanobacteraceae bacterium]
YVAHDDNRDGMALTLNLSRNVLNTFLGRHAQVLHDLHEPAALFYDDTAGAGPYNPWIDPIQANEMHQTAWANVSDMTRLGLLGVFTHGYYDTWSPGYLMSMAMTHNGLARLYETMGTGGADTQEKILNPGEYQRTWYEPNPPSAKFKWSQRDNNNYEQTGLLTSLYHFAKRRTRYLEDFWQVSKRSVERPLLAGPAAYVLTAGHKNHGALMHLLRILHLQHVEIDKATAPFTVTVANDTVEIPATGAHKKPTKQVEPPRVKAMERTFPAGSWIIRMDQPYSIVADELLDREYWSPSSSATPYDDTGWSFGDLFGVNVARVVDTAVLKVPMKRVTGDFDDPALTLASLGVATGGHMPRIALMHTWLSTQTEGWWRMALDRLHVPYTYINTQEVSREPDLRKKFDVILFGPVWPGDNTRSIINGLPMYGPPLPWEHTKLTPHLGLIDSTPDIRPGLGESGVANLKRFVAEGGLLITSEDTAQFAIDVGLAPGVSVTPPGNLRVVGSVLRAMAVDKDNPMVAGYDSRPFALYSAEGLSFNVANQTTGNGGLRTAEGYQRPTGRGGPNDIDIPEGRPFVAPPDLPDVKPWQPVPLNVAQLRHNPYVIPDADRPDVIARWAGADDLLISGLLGHAGGMAEHAAIVIAHYGKGHVVLLSNNPIWRGETIGSYRMFFNAVTHWNQP